MNGKEFARLVARDGYCLHCGETEALAPNHRVNRGMGGSKLRNHPANYVLLCSILNGQIESDARWATAARNYGWKLDSWQTPVNEPVYNSITGEWRLLDDDWSYQIVEGKQ